MDELAVLQILVSEFYSKLDRLDDLVVRDASFPDAPNKIKVAIGMRRVGKTYFLYQKIRELIARGVDRSSILFLNFEDDRLLPMDYHKLAKFIDAFYSLYTENHMRKCYLFFDEIHIVEGWPLVIRRLHDSLDVELFLTGSSAKLLSKEIATNLRGRSLSVEIWPYSFAEYLRAKKISYDETLFSNNKKDFLTKLFHEYLAHGGFPELTYYSADVRQQTLQEYLDSVIHRDIIERHTIKNPKLLKHMILLLIHTTAHPFTMNKFYNEVRSQGYKTGKDILYSYADHIEDTYLAFFVTLYEASFRKQQVNPKKVYGIDPGMFWALVLDKNRDFGRLFENIVYLDLRRRGCNVYYYRTNNGNEIDFIAQTPQGNAHCFQVVWNQESEKTKAREIRALDEGMKELNLPGEIITLDSYLRKGIRFPS